MNIKPILFAALLAVCAGQVQSQVTEKRIVLKTAENQINSFIKDIPDEGISDYGFRNKAEFKKIKFGDPIPVYTLKDSQVVFTSTWRVPVMIDNEYRSLLTVEKDNGSYKAVDFGAAELAKAYAANKTAATTGILRVYQTRTDYLIEESEKGSPMFIQLEFNR